MVWSLTVEISGANNVPTFLEGHSHFKIPEKVETFYLNGNCMKFSFLTETLCDYITLNSTKKYKGQNSFPLLFTKDDPFQEDKTRISL